MTTCIQPQTFCECPRDDAEERDALVEIGSDSSCTIHPPLELLNYETTLSRPVAAAELVVSDQEAMN